MCQRHDTIVWRGRNVDVWQLLLFVVEILMLYWTDLYTHVRRSHRECNDDCEDELTVIILCSAI